MIVKTQAFILKNIKYGDYDIIAKIYTKSNGIQSFMFKGVRKSSKKKNKKNLIPLQPLEIDFKLNEKQQLRFCKDFKVQQPLISLLSEVEKQSIAIFIADLLNESIKEEQADEALFDFIWYSLHYLDSMNDGFANFHLAFTVKLMSFLGFFPLENTAVSNRYYDFQSNNWTITEPVHPNYFTPKHLFWMDELNRTAYNQTQMIITNRKERQAFLQQILLFYQYHLEGMRSLKSVEVLATVFD